MRNSSHERSFMTNPIYEMPPVDARVNLREVTRDNLRAVLALKVRAEQEQNVAGNAYSIAEAHYSQLAWYRAIYADETPVGFAMLKDDPAKCEYHLWRYMLDARYQGRGYGRRALELII